MMVWTVNLLDPELRVWRREILSELFGKHDQNLLAVLKTKTIKNFNDMQFIYMELVNSKNIDFYLFVLFLMDAI